MKKIINVLLTILLCLGCFTINVSALEETTSETQDVINDEDVLDVDSENIAPDPIIEDTENEIVVADETVVEDEGADIVESIEPQETAETQKYSLTVVYSFDDEYTTTLDLTSYKPGEYGFLVSTTDGYVTREVEEETKYYYIDSININSEPVADDKIEINEDDNGNQEYLYLMSEEDVTITVLFSSKKDTESAEYTTEPACYQDGDGNIVLSLGDSYKNSLIQEVKFSASDGSYYRQIFGNEQYDLIDGTITIPYSQIEYSNLKQGLTYQIRLQIDSNYVDFPSSLSLITGSKKKDAPDYNVVQNENGDIVLTCSDEYSVLQIEIISFIGQSFESIDFFGSMLIYKNNTVTIPYKNIKNSQLVEGEYDVQVSFDASKYIYNPLKKPITIYLGSKPTALPDFNIYQEDDGTLVVSSENSDLLDAISKVGYILNNAHHIFNSNEFTIEENKVKIPYENIANSSLLSNKKTTFYITLKSGGLFVCDFDDLKKEVLIKKGSIAEYLSARQEDNGDIIIEISDNILENLEDTSLKYVNFSGTDESNGRNYRYAFYNDKYVILGNTITIPYRFIENSSLKQGLEYQISLKSESNYINLPSELLLNKGSIKKDAPDYSVLQNENGDIVLHSDDSDFLDIVTDISIYGKNSVSFGKQNFVYSSNDRIITIPYKVIEKSQLIEGKYNVDVYYEGMYTDNSPYFDNIPTKSVTITLGSTLPTLPDFNIHQEDNGDIVLYSESEELISQIRRVYYWESNNQRAGSPGFDEKAFFVDKNTITIPYQVVKYSWIEGNKTYVFGIILKNDVFLTNDSNTEKEVFIKLGSLVFDKPYLNICTDYVGAVSIKFDSQEELNKLDNGEYQLNYLLYDCNEKETEIKRDSLVFDYTNKMVYIVTNLESGEDYRINLVKGEEIIASGTYYVNSTPVIDQEALSQNINEEKLLYYANAYYDSLYPNANFNILSIGIYTDVVQDADIDKYFNIYSLSDSNSLILDISLYPTGISGDVDYSKIPYDRPGEYIKLELSASLEQMSKLGITKDNYTQNEIVVLREHNGKVDELEAKLEPVIVSGTIISFKVKFETDKMSLFAIANKVSVIKPSTGSIGGSSTRKPVVNTSAK